jgi:ABC-type multidrug transport system ATPase subunit
MDEATLCDRIALIQSGKILSIDTPENIIGKFPEPLFAIRSSNMSKLLTALRNNPIIKSCFGFGDHHHITLFQKNDADALLRQLRSQFPDIVMTEVTPTIEDCFIQLMQPVHE